MSPLILYPSSTHFWFEAKPQQKRVVARHQLFCIGLQRHCALRSRGAKAEAPAPVTAVARNCQLAEVTD